MPKGSDEARKRAIGIVQGLSPDIDWKLTVSRYRKPNTQSQRGYLYGVVYKYISEWTGLSVKGVHEEMLMQIFGETTKEVFGRQKRVPIRRTAMLNTVEYGSYIDQVLAFAASHGCIIPFPDEHLS